MSADANADALVHCRAGAQLLIAARQFRGDFTGLARRAAGRGRMAERAQQLLPSVRAQLDQKLELYAGHVAVCTECRPRDEAAR